MPRKKRTKTDDPVARTKAEMYSQAKHGQFDKFPELKAMCLSREGYEPIHAQHCLSPYMPDATAASLIATAREAAKVWRHPLAPMKAEGAEESGPAFILVEPWTAGGDYYAKWEREFLSRGWTPPADYKPAVPDRVGTREAIDFRTLLPKPEGGGEGGDGDGQ